MPGSLFCNFGPRYISSVGELFYKFKCCMWNKCCMCIWECKVWLPRKWPLTKVVQVLIAGNIVAHVEPSLPSTKQWKPWPQLQLYRILLRPEITGRDVANFIPIIYITGSSWQNRLERLDGWRSRCTLIIIPRECTLEGGCKRLEQTRKSYTSEWSKGNQYISIMVLYFVDLVHVFF